MHPKEPTAILAVVGTEGVQQVAKRGNVEAVSNKDLFAVDSNDSWTHTQNMSKGIIAHSNPATVNRTVGDEGSLVG